MKKLLIDTAGLENYAGSEEGCSFTFGGGKTTVHVPEPAGDAEFVAAFGEAIRRALPHNADKFNQYMAVMLHCLHVLAANPTSWKRYRKAADALAFQALTRA